MKVFADTSALVAFLDAEDPRNGRAMASFAALAVDPGLLTHSAVVVETVSVVHRRLGADAVRALLLDVLPALKLHHVRPEEHDRALMAFVAHPPSTVSLVDRISFEVMLLHGLESAFVFDDHFREAGFQTVP